MMPDLPLISLFGTVPFCVPSCAICKTKTPTFVPHFSFPNCARIPLWCLTRGVLNSHTPH
jgi:hypothetical protein